MLSALVFALTMGLFVLTDGDPLLALMPCLAGGVAVGLWRLPMRYTAHAVLFLALLFDNPSERPGRGLYQSPLYLPGKFLYLPLEKAIKMPGGKITGLELLFIVLGCICALRVASGDPVDGRNRSRAALPMLQAGLVCAISLFVMEFYGMGRGGSFNHSMLQMRTMLFLPLMSLFFAYAFKSRRDIAPLLITLLTVGFIRGLMCIYYYLTFMRHQAGGAGGQDGDGSYVTTHSDSILAAVVVVICIVQIYQRPTVRAYLLAGVVLPVVGLGVVFNNRRIAFVSVAVGLGFSYLAGPAPFRRRIQRTVLAMIPIVLVYTAAGWNAAGAWAKPVQSLKSVVQQKDTSSATRDVENYNLLKTLEKHPLTGSGFGHQYLELVHAFDISAIFEAYRYVPHNSILWFWGVGGVVGFTLFWQFLAVVVYIAARLCRAAQSNREVVLGMTSITAIGAYAMQSFGDMGLMSWMGSLIVAACAGLSASLAVRSGAWVNRQRRLGALPPAGAMP